MVSENFTLITVTIMNITARHNLWRSVLSVYFYKIYRKYTPPQVYVSLKAEKYTESTLLHRYVKQ